MSNYIHYKFFFFKEELAQKILKTIFSFNKNIICIKIIKNNNNNKF